MNNKDSYYHYAKPAPFEFTGVTPFPAVAHEPFRGTEPQPIGHGGTPVQKPGKPDDASTTAPEAFKKPFPYSAPPPQVSRPERQLAGHQVARPDMRDDISSEKEEQVVLPSMRSLRFSLMMLTLKEERITKTLHDGGTIKGNISTERIHYDVKPKRRSSSSSRSECLIKAMSQEANQQNGKECHPAMMFNRTKRQHQYGATRRKRSNPIVYHAATRYEQ